MDNHPSESSSESANESRIRLLKVRYAILSAILFLPLVWSFIFVRNSYPSAAWNMMMSGGDPHSGRTYFVVKGETVAGEQIEVRPATLTNALYGRTWGMVLATVNNESFKLASPHPDNSFLLSRVGGVGNLPSGVRVPDLLKTWGQLYNARQQPDSPQRLKSITLVMFRWEGGSYANYDHQIDSWSQEL